MSKVFLKKVGKNIRKLRLEKGLSQEKIAEALGISRNAFGLIERGISNTSIARLNVIYKILGVNLGKIFEDIN